VLVDGYVFLEVAKKMEQHARSPAEKGVRFHFGRAPVRWTLAADLREVSHDKHLRVQFRRPICSSSAEVEDRQSQMRRNNYGFERSSGWRATSAISTAWFPSC
jgi:hypothetical protein